MSNYNDFDLDIRSTHNSGPVDPQSVIPVTVTCNMAPFAMLRNCSALRVIFAILLWGARMVARDLVSLENRPKLILIVGLLVVDGVRVKQYMYS